MLRHRFITLLVTLATIATTVLLYIQVPKGFFPQQDTGRLTGQIIADQSTSFQLMSRILDQYARIVAQDPAVDNVIAFCGGQGGGGTNTGRMFVALKPNEDRKISADEVIARIRKRAAGVPGAQLVLQSVQDLRIGGRASAAQYQYTLQGDDLDELNEWAPKMLAKAQTLPGLTDVNSDQQIHGLQARLTYDRTTASRLNISAQDLDNISYDAFGQRQVSTMYTQLNQYHVVMEASPEFWQSPDGLKHIYVRSAAGALVPLGSVAQYAPSSTSLAVNHQGQFPAITISFNLKPGVSLGEAVTNIQQAARDMGLPASIHGSFAGTAQAYQASLASEPILILTALAAVYIVLGVLYESYIHPITILSTLPSAGVGALLALMLTGNDLNVIALIGIVLLIGIVKKNAIMMIDFALEAERKEGLPPSEAIYKACVLRFRPIMMTTLAAAVRRHPAGGGDRHRRRAAPPAGHRHRGRLDLQPDADALHDAGRLRLPRPAQALVRGAARGSEGRRRGSRGPLTAAAGGPGLNERPGRISSPARPGALRRFAGVGTTPFWSFWSFWSFRSFFPFAWNVPQAEEKNGVLRTPAKRRRARGPGAIGRRTATEVMTFPVEFKDPPLP